MACLLDSISKFVERNDKDPIIVRAIDKQGEPLDHFFYMSENYLACGEHPTREQTIPGYEGPTSEIPKEHVCIYLQCRIDTEWTEKAKRIKSSGIGLIETWYDVYQGLCPKPSRPETQSCTPSRVSHL